MDWLEALREACLKSSQAKVATKLGVSTALISQVLNGKYPGDLNAIEKAVRGLYLGETVTCPLLGAISGKLCLDWQKKPFAATNEFRVMMFRACRDSCPHSRIVEDK